jgi:hypothetical protein
MGKAIKLNASFPPVLRVLFLLLLKQKKIGVTFCQTSCLHGIISRLLFFDNLEQWFSTFL